MNETTKPAIHWSFWVIGAVGLIWHAMGTMNLLMQMNPENLANYPESHRAVIEGQPLWAKLGFAVSVIGGLIGSVFLLMRRSLAYPVFIAALVGTVLVQARSLSLGIGFSMGDILLTIIGPLAVLGFLVWYTRASQAKGLLR